MDEAKRQEGAVIINSFRPLLQQLQVLVTKDHNLKKKRVWRRDKDSTVALDHIQRQLDFRTRSIDQYLSTMRSSQLAFIEKKLETFVQELKHGIRPVGHESDADAQWSVLRRKLIEDGITDVDIEAHAPSIRALLRDKLPSYNEIHAGPAHEGDNYNSANPSTGSPGQRVRRSPEFEHPNFNHNNNNNNKADFSADVPSILPNLLSPGLTPPIECGPGQFPLLALTEDDIGRRSQQRSSTPTSILKKPHGKRMSLT